MTENKRFTVVNHNEYAEGDLIYYDNGEEMGSLDVVDKLNELNCKIERYEFIVKESIKTERTDMGRNVLIQLAESLNIEVD